MKIALFVYLAAKSTDSGDFCHSEMGTWFYQKIATIVLIATQNLGALLICLMES
jgi:hypothetical protein